jgi:rod shape-determining protein MreD
VVLQTSVADILFSGRLVLEISMIPIIYAGFRLDLVKGLILAFILGFVYDCLSGSLLGLFTLIYMVIFLCSFFISIIVSSEKLHFIALFSFICSFLEENSVFLFYSLAYGSETVKKTFFMGVPRAMLMSLLTVLFFYMLHRTEGFINGEEYQPAQQSRTSRFSAQT